MFVSKSIWQRRLLGAFWEVFYSIVYSSVSKTNNYKYNDKTLQNVSQCMIWNWKCGNNARLNIFKLVVRSPFGSRTLLSSFFFIYIFCFVFYSHRNRFMRLLCCIMYRISLQKSNVHFSEPNHLCSHVREQFSFIFKHSLPSIFMDICFLFRFQQKKILRFCNRKQTNE